MNPLSVHTGHVLLRVPVWLPCIDKGSLSHIAIFMKEGIPHGCIRIDRPRPPFVIWILKHGPVIECRTVRYIIASPVDAKVFDIDLWERYVGIEEKVGRKEKLLIEGPGISRSIKDLRISCISDDRLGREEVRIELYLH